MHTQQTKTFTKFIHALAMGLLIINTSTTAMAKVIVIAGPQPGPGIQGKCGRDKLEVSQAKERLYWAVKCELIGQKVMEGYMNHELPIYPVYLRGNQIYKTPVDRNAPCDPQITTEAIVDGILGRIMCTSYKFDPNARYI